jgi:hypothetical protein
VALKFSIRMEFNDMQSLFIQITKFSEYRYFFWVVPVECSEKLLQDVSSNLPKKSLNTESG